jgi:predicted negative regulator of RcsB-dependent stress response
LFKFSSKEGTVGTTKLTRKEIISEDPIHDAMLKTVEYLRGNGAKVGVAVVVITVLAFGIYSGIQYLESRDVKAQIAFAKGLDYFHAEVSADATEDPYGKGPIPTFKSESAKYQAAIKEFSPIASGYFYGKLAVLARYYLGITQLKLGEQKEALQNLESVAGSSSNRTIGFLAKRALAIQNFEAGNYKKAQELLDSLVKDPKCDLQKEDLSIQLSRVLVAQGKREDAIKVLNEANAQGPSFGRFQSRLTAELEKLQKSAKSGTDTQPAQP